MCILCVNTLLKVVSHYDLCFLYMSLIGFQKQSLDRWVDGVSFFGMFFN